MYEDPNQSFLSKSILTGLFAGIIATLVSFIFEITYREATGYGQSIFINVSSIIFVVNLILLAAGLTFYRIKISFKRGNLIFFLLALITTAFCIWKSESFHQFANKKLSMESSHLLSGVLLIVGLSAMLIPFFFSNKRIGDFIL